jgi:hypothetical protein
MAAVIPIILAVVSTAATVYSSVSSSQEASHAEHKAERAAATAAQQAQEHAGLEAEQNRLATEQKTADYERRARAALSTERSERGASGISMAGSPLLTYYENAKVFEEDLGRIRQAGLLGEEAVLQRGDVLSTQYKTQAGIHRDYAKAEKEAGYYKAGSTILTGASNVFSEGRKVGWW